MAIGRVCDQAPPPEDCGVALPMKHRALSAAFVAVVFKKLCGAPRRNVPMRVLLTAMISAAILLILGWPAQSQEIPDINVDPVCHGISQQAANPSETGGPDLAFAQCVKSEQAMRAKLAHEWPTFAPAEKSNCIASQGGGLASYTDLATCLEMARDVKQLNQNK
jgi:hypothetical protein